MIDKWLEYIIQLLPTIISILGSVTIIAKALTTFKKIKEDTAVNREYQELKNQLKLSVQQNYELKKQYNELLTEITKIKRGE